MLQCHSYICWPSIALATSQLASEQPFFAADFHGIHVTATCSKRLLVQMYYHHWFWLPAHLLTYIVCVTRMVSMNVTLPSKALLEMFT